MKLPIGDARVRSLAVWLLLLAICGANYAVAQMPENSAAEEARRAKAIEASIAETTVVIQSGKSDSERVANAYQNRADNYFFLDKYDLAAADYSKTIEFVTAALRTNNRTGGSTVYGAMAQAETGGKLEERLIYLYGKRAISHKNLGKYSSAADDYSAIIKLGAKDGDGYLYERARVYLEVGTYEAALADLNKLLGVKPEYAPAIYLLRGKIRSRQGQHESAVADYSRVIESNKDPFAAFEARFMRAVSHTELKNLDLAVADYTEIIKKFPSAQGDARLASLLFQVHFSRAQIYAEQNKLDLAVADYTKAIENNSSSPDGYHYRGHLYSYQNKFELAIADFTKALALNKDAAHLLNDRADAYASNQKLDLAIADLNQVVQLKPGEPRAYVLRAAIYCYQGKKAEALSDEKKVIEFGGTIAERCK